MSLGKKARPTIFPEETSRKVPNMAGFRIAAPGWVQRHDDDGVLGLGGGSWGSLGPPRLPGRRGGLVQNGFKNFMTLQSNNHAQKVIF